MSHFWFFICCVTHFCENNCLLSLSLFLVSHVSYTKFLTNSVPNYGKGFNSPWEENSNKISSYSTSGTFPFSSRLLSSLFFEEFEGNDPRSKVSTSDFLQRKSREDTLNLFPQIPDFPWKESGVETLNLSL